MKTKIILILCAILLLAVAGLFGFLGMPLFFANMHHIEPSALIISLVCLGSSVFFFINAAKTIYFFIQLCTQSQYKNASVSQVLNAKLPKWFYVPLICCLSITAVVLILAAK